jgi:hypothetical protein
MTNTLCRCKPGEREEPHEDELPTRKASERERGSTTEQEILEHTRDNGV